MHRATVKTNVHQQEP